MSARQLQLRGIPAPGRGQGAGQGDLVGGIIGAWAVLTVRDGRLDFSEFDTIGTLTASDARDVEGPDPDFEARYRRFAAPGHEALLRLTGPVDLPDVRRIDADSVVDFVTNEQWAEFPEDAARKPVLGSVAEVALGRCSSRAARRRSSPWWRQKQAWDGRTYRLVAPAQPVMRPVRLRATVHPPRGRTPLPRIGDASVLIVHTVIQDEVSGGTGDAFGFSTAELVE